ncbi:MAG: AbrB/MazE/SpoVT family DNA-binding domain-containing protein [Candidatus Micrarchaeota archaeon]
MNVFTKSLVKNPRIIACRLDSKARLVLPLVIREKLSVNKGDIVSFEVEFSGASVFLRLCKNMQKGLNRSSRNGWEK